MKKIFIILVLVFPLFVFLIGCSTVKPSEVKTKTEQSTEDSLQKEKDNAIERLELIYDNFKIPIDLEYYEEVINNIKINGKNNIMKSNNIDEINKYFDITSREMSSIRDFINKYDKSINNINKIFLPSEKYTIGSGTKNDPYIINSPMELLYLSKETYYGKSAGKYYALGCDIDLDGITWIPIGSTEHSSAVTKYFSSEGIKVQHAFRGSFDGRGHVIKNLRMNGDLYFEDTCLKGLIGLFGGNEGEIKNVGLIDYIVDIDTNPKKLLSIGSICAINSGTISNCFLSGEMKICFDYDDFEENDYDDFEENEYFYDDWPYMGIIVGYNDVISYISNCITIITGYHMSEDFEIIYIGEGFSNCLVVGSLDTDFSYQFIDYTNCVNCFTYINELNENNTCTAEDLNNKYFYINTLGLDNEIWDLDDIIFQNGAYLDGHYPKLRIKDN